MKINKSLAALGSAITILVVVGLVVGFAGAMFVSYGLGAYDGSGSLLWGYIFLYIGSGLVGIGIFASFLRQTARVIVEGLGGNINTASAGIPAFRPEDK